MKIGHPRDPLLALAAFSRFELLNLSFDVPYGLQVLLQGLQVLAAGFPRNCPVALFDLVEDALGLGPEAGVIESFEEPIENQFWIRGHRHRFAAAIIGKEILAGVVLVNVRIASQHQ